MEEMDGEIHLILSWELWVSDFYAWFLLFWCAVERTKRLVCYVIWARVYKFERWVFCWFKCDNWLWIMLLMLENVLETNKISYGLDVMIGPKLLVKEI